MRKDNNIKIRITNIPEYINISKLIVAFDKALVTSGANLQSCSVTYVIKGDENE